jgi:hypothetical protein
MIWPVELEVYNSSFIYIYVCMYVTGYRVDVVFF